MRASRWTVVVWTGLRHCGRRYLSAYRLWAPASMVPNTAGPSTLRSLRFRPYGLSSMVLRAYVELHIPIAKVEEALLRTPAERIPGLASSAYEHCDRLLAVV